MPSLLLSSRAFSGHPLSFPVMFLSESTAAFNGGGNPTVDYALTVDHGKEEEIGEEIEIRFSTVIGEQLASLETSD